MGAPGTDARRAGRKAPALAAATQERNFAPLTKSQHFHDILALRLPANG
jgi:hypothetical protein